MIKQNSKDTRCRQVFFKFSDTQKRITLPPPEKIFGFINGVRFMSEMNFIS